MSILKAEFPRCALVAPVLAAALTCSGLYAQTPQLVQTYPPLRFTCTAPTSTIGYGAKYTNTCTVTQGQGPFVMSVFNLPPGLAVTKTSTSITVSGTSPVGNYTYEIDFSGGGYSYSWILVGLNVNGLTTSATGKATIHCIQKGGPTIADPPLCQACIVTASGRICNLDDKFNPTGKTPQAPSGAVVTSVYLDSAPLTYNVQAYTLTVSHKDTTNVSKQIAYQTSGRSPAYATKSVPVNDFNGQLVEADGGRWSFNFSPLMINSSPFVQWGLDFLYNITYQVVSPIRHDIIKPSLQSSAALAQTGDTAISGLDSKTDLSLAAPSKVGAPASAGWKAIAFANLTGGTDPDILLQNAGTDAVAVWAVSGSQVAEKLELSSTPGPGWKLVGAADLTGDGISDLLFQNEKSGVVEVWQMSGTNVAARLQLPSIPDAGWNISAVGDLLGAGSPVILLQNNEGDIRLWTMSGLDVVAQSEIANLPASGWKVLAVADMTGDGIPDLLVNDARGGRLAAWQMLDGNVIATREVDTLAARDDARVVAFGQPGTDGAPAILLQNAADGTLGFSRLSGAVHGEKFPAEPARAPVRDK